MRLKRAVAGILSLAVLGSVASTIVSAAEQPENNQPQLVYAEDIMPMSYDRTYNTYTNNTYHPIVTSINVYNYDKVVRVKALDGGIPGQDAMMQYKIREMESGIIHEKLLYVSDPAYKVTLAKGAEPFEVFVRYVRTGNSGFVTSNITLKPE